MRTKISWYHLTKKVGLYVFLYAVTFWILFSSLWLVPSQSYTYNFPILRTVIVFFAAVLLVKYFFYMFLSPWHDVVVAYKKKKNVEKIKQYKPFVSVMIPAWNEQCGILDTIRTLLKSTYTKMEIIIVNDGSTDNSDTLIKEFIHDYEIQNRQPGAVKNEIEIVYEYKKNAGKGAALNTAIRLSGGDIVVSIDADCIVLPDTIENFVSYFVDPRIMAAVGNVKVANTKKIIGVVQYLEFLFAFYFKKADSLMNTIYIIGGAAGAFRREIFDSIGTYNTTNITEDIDLSMRIQNAGMKIVYAADAVVYTEGAHEVRGLMKQRLRWTRGRIETFIENRHLFFSVSPQHNRILSWIILPLACFGEMQLSMELFFLVFLYWYSYMISDFSSFISGILIVTSMFFVQTFFDNKKTHSLWFYILSPIGWLLFYITTYIEFSALFNSIVGLIKKEKLKWQRWQRQGVKG